MGNGAVATHPRSAAEERAVQERQRPGVVSTPNGQIVTAIDPAKLGFKPAGTDTRFCKFGFYGEPGSGKTTTASWIAREIATREGKKVAYMLDSEGGSDFVESVFAKRGIQLHVIKTREFSRLVNTIEAMQSSGEILLVDSVTHFWNDLTQSYLQQNNKKKLDVQDFGILYETWRLFTKPYLASQLHILVCMRMGWEYTTTINEDTGKREFYKSDTKVKAGDQFGHEPSLLVHLEQIKNAALVQQLTNSSDKRERSKIGLQMSQEGSIDFVATVEKDRNRFIMARQFIFTASPDDEANAAAVIAAFDPVIAWHLKGKSHSGFEQPTGANVGMIPASEDNRAYFERRKRKELVLGEIEATFTRWFPSTAAKERQAAVMVLEKVLGVRSWAAVQQLGLEVLEAVIAPQTDGPALLERASIEKREALDSGAKPAKDKAGPAALPES